MGTPSTAGCLGRDHPREVRGPAGGGDDHPSPRASADEALLEREVGRAVRGHHAHLVRNVEPIWVSAQLDMVSQSERS